MSETAVNGVEPIIFLDDVHVTFRTRTGSILHPNLVHAVQGVTIKLMPGQTIGIVGESGCGKSTTANVMCGLQAPTSGKVYFKGKDVTKEGINAAMKAAASASFGYNEDPIVSSDVIGMRYGSLFDATQTMVSKIDDDTYQVQVVSWYDNENSYTSQMVRTIKYFAELA